MNKVDVLGPFQLFHHLFPYTTIELKKVETTKERVWNWLSIRLKQKDINLNERTMLRRKERVWHEKGKAETKMYACMLKYRGVVLTESYNSIFDK